MITYTTSEVAKILNTHPQNVYYRINNKQLGDFIGEAE